MKNGFLKIALASPKIRLADPEYNAMLAVETAKEAAENGAKILLFPELTLSGASAADLFFQSVFISKCEAALCEYVRLTAALDIISFIGLPIKRGAKLYNAVAAVSHGKILGIST